MTSMTASGTNMSNTSVESTVQNKPIFRELNADDQEPETTNIESACMNCFQTGSTQLLLTKIPFFKEVVLMSFKCDHCGFENNEIQSASEIQKQGCRIILNVSRMEDLNRRCVRSDYTALSIPELELEIPAQTQKGDVTTIEGILDRAIRGLTQDQDKRKVEHPDAAEMIEKYVARIVLLKNLEKTFTIVLEDISGNSFIENPSAPAVDLNCKTTHFNRTKKQDEVLCLYAPENDAKDEPKNKDSLGKHLLQPIEEGSWPLEELHNEVLQFQTLCSSCRSPCVTNMKITNIPHFKEVVIMATSCDVCGCKSNEVKSGGGIEEQGIRFEIQVHSNEDLSRDVLKSETCSLKIPELDCEVGPSALCGRFTTVEGILVAMKEQLEGDGIMFHDSSDDKSKQRLSDFIKKFSKIINLEVPATLILDDPAGNSYVQSLSDDDDADAKLIVSRYKRTFEQNEELGLNDIKTENY